jgi:hypothetical protein
MSGQRRRLGIDSWREVMRRFDASGSTVSAFCMHEGLNPTSFYRWRARLSGGSGTAGSHDAPAAHAPEKQPTGAGFIELGSLAQAADPCPGGLELRLELGGGVVLHLSRR